MPPKLLFYIALTYRRSSGGNGGKTPSKQSGNNTGKSKSGPGLPLSSLIPPAIEGIILSSSSANSFLLLHAKSKKTLEVNVLFGHLPSYSSSSSSSSSAHSNISAAVRYEWEKCNSYLNLGFIFIY